ncbi:nucleotide exchange factor GrpE [Oecophyllibacter saccharovorans]|uniref:nucleotide exchange factor GrpE n=1 Tax=Oecophyllibacter saccharovorans TaxID=2558360 RepID=UPI001141DF21|nr:nucleotide exchange factor GrpE [Oecophyllibacter saccharovorans]QDH15358.1 nucleotide exchange factor GrpE [Oecophyllibacter saccharovorans]TPW36376.1 nucleotide exchange factor GrpE [Oecophyllibacter saccharovorans]
MKKQHSNSQHGQHQNPPQHEQGTAAAPEQEHAQDQAPEAEAQSVEGAEGALDPQERITQLEAELEEMKNRWMRAEAEVQNVRNRAQREVSDARLFGLQKFAKDIVEGAENLERAIASLPVVKQGEVDIAAIMDKTREGLKSTERSLLSILERHGITRHEAEGQAFDANEHQAMQEVASPDHAPGQIVQVWSPTWKLNNRLLKPAMVVVANGDSTGKGGAKSPAGGN